MEIEIIEGNPIKIVDPKFISTVEAAKLLRMSRQWTATLMRKYIEDQEGDSIPCMVVGGQYYTTQEDLREYYNRKVEEYKQNPSK